MKWLCAFAWLRLLRQALTESLLLSVAGSLFGVVLAYFGADALVRIIESGRPIPGLPAHIGIHFQPDLHVLLFTGGVALLTGLLFGVAPALLALRTVPASALQQSRRIGEPGFRRLFGQSLVVTQVALSVVLLSVAALFVGYLSNLERLNVGFRRDHLLLVSLDRARSGYEDAQFSRLCGELLGRLEAIPGVSSATLSAITPISGAGASGFATVKGHAENRRDVTINWVAPNYFETYGTPLLAGRKFSAQDQGGPRVAIVNRATAGDLFGDRNPIGEYVTLDHATARADDGSYEIAGVVGDAKYAEIREATPRTIYLDVFQDQRVASQLTLRTSVDPVTVAAEVRANVRELLRTVSVDGLTTMADQIDASIVPERLITMLSGCLGALGALLAAIGLYGLVAYTVARRVNEIGIRMALGATRSNVTGMVLGDALWTVCVGLVIGAPLAFWVKSIAVSLIQDLPITNIVPIAFAATAMIATALLSAYFPAHRASRVDPMVALRYE